jgi:hypothetical protein
MKKSIGAIIIDTYESRKFLSIAIDMVSACPNVQEICLVSNKDFHGIKNIRINRINSLAEYNKLILVDVCEHITQDFALIFQWDGFPLNENSWSDEFYKYDFIGAPHFSELYRAPFLNGGFSLRSKRLLDKVRNVVNAYPTLVNHPEDAVICHLLREKLESSGIFFPDLSIAEQFSYELGTMPERFFGFHGAFNFPFFFKEVDLVNLSDELMERLNQPNIILHLLNNAYQMNYLNFIQVCFHKVESWPGLKLVMEHLSRNPSESEVGKLVEKFLKTN